MSIEGDEIPAAVLDLEIQSIGPNGQPMLGAAFELLRAEWLRGRRNRELALHLLFLCWYMLVEPPFLTGLDESRVSPDELSSLFNAIHESFVIANLDDAEVLYTTGLAAHLFPWALGDIATWERRGAEYRKRYRALAPSGLDPSLFAGRGAYGDYFARQARVEGGY